MSLFDLIDIDDGWRKKFKEYISEKYFDRLAAKVGSLRETRTIYPSSDKVFRAFKLCPYEDVKVIICGLDPYHNIYKGIPVATGLAFESAIPSYIPPSLRNIIKEVKDDVGGKCDIEDWARQGVLLLNTALTVNEGLPESHLILWREFTEGVFKALSDKSDLIYLLWGRKSQGYEKYIEPWNHILKATHPSPLGANQGGWFGCKHFSKSNELLGLRKKINW